MVRKLLIALFLPLWLAAGSAQAFIIVLDSTNSYEATIEAGATIQQPSATFEFFITGTGIQFAIGTSDVASFPGQTQIGGCGPTCNLGGFRPVQLVFGDVDFTILVTGSGNKYDAHLTYFFSQDEGGVSAQSPVPNNFAGAVFELERAVSAPRAATLALLAFGLAGSCFSRRKY